MPTKSNAEITDAADHERVDVNPPRGQSTGGQADQWRPAAVEMLLPKAGFKFKGGDPRGYGKWYHPDGSKVQIRPNGEVVRYKGHQRYGSDGNPTSLHSTGETINGCYARIT